MVGDPTSQALCECLSHGSKAAFDIDRWKPLHGSTMLKLERWNSFRQKRLRLQPEPTITEGTDTEGNYWRFFDPSMRSFMKVRSQAEAQIWLDVIQLEQSVRQQSR
ncbi:MAG: hypothetical protein MUF49_25270 [Oculatellaceae cyanobacterium Prado106]|jgi:hypothetical protein|nr:hypothetical protein [Oculatellaceae cyanobacterium Prado106]